MLKVGAWDERDFHIVESVEEFKKILATARRENISDPVVKDLYLGNLDLSSISLRNITFKNTRFAYCTARRVKFRNVNFDDCYVTCCNFVETVFENTAFNDSIFNMVNFTESVFTNLCCENSHIADCNFSGTKVIDFRKASEDIVFEHCDFLDAEIAGDIPSECEFKYNINLPESITQLEADEAMPSFPYPRQHLMQVDGGFFKHFLTVNAEKKQATGVDYQNTRLYCYDMQPYAVQVIHEKMIQFFRMDKKGIAPWVLVGCKIHLAVEDERYLSQIMPLLTDRENGVTNFKFILDDEYGRLLTIYVYGNMETGELDHSPEWYDRLIRRIDDILLLQNAKLGEPAYADKPWRGVIFATGRHDRNKRGRYVSQEHLENHGEQYSDISNPGGYDKLFARFLVTDPAEIEQIIRWRAQYHSLRPFFIRYAKEVFIADEISGDFCDSVDVLRLLLKKEMLKDVSAEQWQVVEKSSRFFDKLSAFDRELLKLYAAVSLHIEWLLEYQKLVRDIQQVEMSSKDLDALTEGWTFTRLKLQERINTLRPLAASHQQQRYCDSLDAAVEQFLINSNKLRHSCEKQILSPVLSMVQA